MFARITQYQMKPDKVDDAKRLLEELKPKIMALPGVQQFLNTMNADGSGCVISVVDSQATSDANAEATQALWAQFKDHLQSAPEPGGYDVIADWRN